MNDGINISYPEYFNNIGLSNDTESYLNNNDHEDRLLKLEKIVNNVKSNDIYNVPAGMALSVWEDKYARRKSDNTFQSWEERLREVVIGNLSLDNVNPINSFDVEEMTRLSLQGVLGYSGRHLQHGDRDQHSKNMELFTNCSSALFSLSSFWLLLNGSGVGGDYSCYTRRINWSKYMPHVRFVLGEDHPDFGGSYSEFEGFFESKRDAIHKYPANSEDVRWFEVEDSREGWVKIVEILETAAWQEKHSDKLFIFDFTKVRCAGSSIKGQQNRPASGPVPLMRALANVANLKGIPNMACWKQAMFIDHYLAACVVLGGVRRSARMATKWWKDPDVFDFIECKRGGFLWTANISVTVNAEFWEQTNDPRSHGARVLQAITAAQYHDMTGEPGILNMDRMCEDKTGFETITGDNYLNEFSKLQLHPRTKEMMGKIVNYIKDMPHPFIVNPCAEIILSIYGGYCVVGDVCLAHARSLDDARAAVKHMSKALIRVNLMNGLYKAEVARTNRIGVAITGLHEFAAKLYGFNFNDLISDKATALWEFISELRHIVEKEANAYSKSLGLNNPHTYSTVKPSGTISKVLTCTEGVHLPAVKYYNRWVQFIKSIEGGKENPKVTEFRDRGYPIKDISHQYHNAIVVGFPTKQPLVDILGERTITAGEASIEDQFTFIGLIEKYWFGSKEDGTPANNQVSYTLKYPHAEMSYPDYHKLLHKGLPNVRALSIMPIMDMSAYAYQPEEEIDKATYDSLLAKIDSAEREEYDNEMLNCAGGVCAIDNNIN